MTQAGPCAALGLTSSDLEAHASATQGRLLPPSLLAIRVNATCFGSAALSAAAGQSGPFPSQPQKGGTGGTAAGPAHPSLPPPRAYEEDEASGPGLAAMLAGERGQWEPPSPAGSFTMRQARGSQFDRKKRKEGDFVLTTTGGWFG